jgi:hypothetical protein
MRMVLINKLLGTIAASESLYFEYTLNSYQHQEAGTRFGKRTAI